MHATAVLCVPIQKEAMNANAMMDSEEMDRTPAMVYTVAVSESKFSSYIIIIVHDQVFLL